MTVGEFQAKKIERIAAALAHFIETTRPDRLDWNVPGEGESKGRSVLEQASECALVNRLGVKLLRGEEVDRAAAQANAPRYASAADAGQDLIGSAAELASAIRTMTDEDLARTYPCWRGPVSGEVLVEMAYRNMAYHAGQVNFIQCLYGDNEFHVPPTWM
jgi:hypothetical protein